MKTYRDEDEFDADVARMQTALMTSPLTNADLQGICIGMGLLYGEYDEGDRSAFAYFIAEVALGGSWPNDEPRDTRQA